jgi:hypothetical protein
VASTLPDLDPGLRLEGSPVTLLHQSRHGAALHDFVTAATDPV